MCEITEGSYGLYIDLHWHRLFLAYAAKIPVGIAQIFQKGGYDNNNPRTQQAGLEGFGARALAAHQNSFEVFPAFAVAAYAAASSGYNIDHVNYVAAAFVASRVLYIVCYLFDLAWVRSAIWFVGFIAIYIEFYFAVTAHFESVSSAW